MAEILWALVNVAFWITGLALWTSAAFWVLVLWPTFLADRRAARESDELTSRRAALDALTSLHEEKTA